MAALAFGWAGKARRAEAQARPNACDAVRVGAGNDLPPPWQEAVEALRTRAKTLPRDDCQAVEITVRRDGDRVIASASTADGRRAERAIRTPSDLVPVALGLVASIPPEEEERPVATRATPPSSVAPDESKEPDEKSRPLPEPTPPSLRLSLGAATGVRAGFPTSAGMFEIEGFANLLARDWVVSASVRWVPYGWRFTPGPPGEQYSYQEVALGLGFGRRFTASSLVIDAIASTVLVSSTESTGEGYDSDGGFKAQVRLDAAFRLSLPITRHWSAVAVLDGELDPFHVAAPIRFDPESPPLPTWTIGLRLGASGDLL
ncbi:hypothetical protein AKJ09_01531 [Labilithrix luteola]|uniref:Uncharacterized protein n=1 Tax=Labilithrix luteola TaxID=1391654 RepID=A0A0K1PMX5_9BACT|nr:hypothetical protein [Labilithrix luteola]AKU94867.1 hypothetical protein AKJ09_01531 [Labilithrix luteola]